MTRTYRLFFCLLSLALLGVTPIARAAQFSLWPSVAVDEAYDDNVRVTPSNTKGDFVTVESLGATLDAEAPARSFFLTYNTLMIEHASYSNEDRFGRDHYVGLRDNEQLSANSSLTIADSFLSGNAVSGSFIANGSTPIGSQLLSSLLFNVSTASNNFGVYYKSRYSAALTWSASLYQVFFSTSSTASSNVSIPASSADSFQQGGTLAGDWDLGERFTAGPGYNFDDFRFSNRALPTTESHWPQLRLGWGAGTPITVLAHLGPIIAQSTSGTVGTRHQPAKTRVDVGYLLSGTYTGRRLLVSASAGQSPNLSAGIGAFSVSQNYAALVQYKLTRKTTAFANFGYMNISGSGVSVEVLTYTTGVSYRLTRILTANVQYLGYQTSGTGSSIGVLVAAPGRAYVNFFMLGLTVTPLPIQWRY